MTKCDVCGRGDRTIYFVENDKVRDGRMRRAHYYNVMHVCEDCYHEWQCKLWAQVAGETIARGER